MNAAVNKGSDYPQLMLENQLCFPLYAAARKVINLYTPYLRPYGLTYTQYLVLLLLWQEDSRSVSSICQKLMLDCGTLTPVIKKLEVSGLVTRKRVSSDARVVTVSLTEKGACLRDEVKDIPSQIGPCVPIGQDDAQTLYRLLYKLIDK